MEMAATYKKLEKLCPGDKYPTQQRILDNARIPGTCQWFLNHETTQAWLNGDGHHILWLHGPSASGKTFLSLVNHIHQTQYESIACGVFYFGRNDLQYNLADYDLAFRSITRQLVSQTPDSLGLWQSITDNEEMETPCLDVSSKIIEQISSAFDKIIVILDGVDATNESGLNDLFHLLFDERIIPSLKILITSRLPFPNALDRIDLGISEIEAHAPESDIGLYFASYIDESPVDAEFPDPARVRLFPYKKFFDLSKGLYVPLLPQWFSNIASQPNSVFFDLVESSPPESKGDVSRAFCEAVMEDIKSSKDANLIMCVLYHLIVIDRMGYLFTVPMAHEALDTWGTTRPDGNPFTASEILKSCQGLIFLNDKNQTIVMRSPLLMEHLRTHVLTNFHHQVQTRVSMRYLSKQDFANGASKSSAQLKERFWAHPYLWYAARSLSSNLTKGDCFESFFLALTTSQGSIESYQQAAEAWPYLDDESYDECERSCERWRCYTAGYTALHLAASLGVADMMVQRLVSDGAHLDARDGSGQTALHIAAGIEDESVTLKSLLLAGSDVAVKDRDGLTPLAICVVHGNLASVKLLIEYGADVSTLDEEDLRECAREKPEIAQFLVELGIDMPDVDEDEDEDEDEGN
uniref:Nephrocystin 3-like N-terminal domain-containing protein n=1 Tax=Gibberella zeae TaxID=5518 RepID=A0A4E9EGL8_GIBZA